MDTLFWVLIALSLTALAGVIAFIFKVINDPPYCRLSQQERDDIARTVLEREGVSKRGKV